MMYTVPKVLLFFSVIGLSFSDMHKPVQNTYFTGGEELTFKVKYLFFNAAEARFTVSKTIYQLQKRPTYKIDVYGKTLNKFKIFYVKDKWGSYLDIASLVPYISFRHIEVGNYRKHVQVNFDHEKGVAVVNTFDR